MQTGLGFQIQGCVRLPRYNVQKFKIRLDVEALYVVAGFGGWGEDTLSKNTKTKVKEIKLTGLS